MPWHQDRIIAVAERIEAEGYSNWSKKSGVWHCDPPVGIFSDMLFLRVHLDENNEENGAMQIAVGSHKQGLISSADAAQIAQLYEAEVCEAARGDELALNMLSLHRSLPSRTNTPRRALRIDFATDDLPAPLSWIE